MTTTNTAHGRIPAEHPIELALVAGLALAQALLPLIAMGIALVLTIAGLRPEARANAPIAPLTVQMPQLPPAADTICTRIEPRRTVAQLRAQCRERGLPSRLWKSARRAELLVLLEPA